MSNRLENPTVYTTEENEPDQWCDGNYPLKSTLSAGLCPVTNEPVKTVLFTDLKDYFFPEFNVKYYRCMNTDCPLREAESTTS